MDAPACRGFESNGVRCFAVNPGWVRIDLGGPGATLSPEAAATAIIAVIDSAGDEDQTKLLNHDGTQLRW